MTNNFDKYCNDVDKTNPTFLEILEMCNVVSKGESFETCTLLEKAFKEKNISKKEFKSLLHKLFKEFADLENEYRDILLSFQDCLKDC